MATIAQIANKHLGVEIEGSGRFARDGWAYRGVTRASCPECRSPLHEARKPYTAAGRPQEYRAYICSGCPRIWDRKGLAARLLP